MLIVCGVSASGSKSYSRRSIVIVGGGLFGLAAALELQSATTQVTVLETGTVPRDVAASTDISKVVRMDYGGDEAYTTLGEGAIAGWRDWNARFGEQLYREAGFLVMRRGTMSPGEFEHDSFTLLTRRGHTLQRLDAMTYANRFTAWAAGGYSDGYFNPVGGWAASGRSMWHLSKAAKDSGVVVREQTAVARLIETQSRVTGVITASGGRITADLVLIASGAWTPVLLPELSTRLSVTGQPVFHFRVNDPKQWQPPHFPVWAAEIGRTGWYGFPSLDDGTLKIANHGPGRRVHPDEPRVVLPAEIEHCRTFLRTSLPKLADAPLIGTRLCLYSDSHDGDFLIDHVPDRPGLVVASGDSGHAFKFAPVIGSVIAAVVSQSPHPLRSRFGWRESKGQSGEGARALRT